MKNRTGRFLVIILTAAIVFLFSGCPNNLVDTIEKEVEVVVTPPSVKNIYPAASATSVSSDSQISVTFTKNIDQTTVNSASFIVKDSFGNATSGIYSVSNDTVTFTPNNLYYDASYTITITGAILDVDGNPLTENFSWDFSTEKAPSNLKPVIRDFQIDNGKSITNSSVIALEIDAEDYNGERTGMQYRYHLVTDSSWSSWADLNDGFISISETITPGGTDAETFTFEAEVRDKNMVYSDIYATSIIYKTSPPGIDASVSNPVPGSVVPSNQSYVDVVFDSEMDPGSISSSTVYVSKGINKISTVEYTLINNNRGVRFSTFELGGSTYFFEQNTDYTVFVAGTVSDVAGNQIGNDLSYSFSTGTAVDTSAPEGEVVLNLDSSEFNATPANSFDLEIKAVDDYNGVRAVKIWGDNDGTLPLFESDASWKLYTEGSTTPGLIDYMSYNANFGNGNWVLNNIDGDYYIFYKFIDFAGNESSTPGRVRISLDTTNPVLNGIQIDSGTGYSNSENDKINIIIDADDLQSGLKEMWISSEASSTSNPPASGSGTWQAWNSLTTDYSLSSGEGMYYVYGEVRDYVTRVSGVGYSSIILDHTKPSVSFSDTDRQEVNSASLQTVTIADEHPASSPAAWQIPSGMGTYQWEQLSGPGTLEFYSDSACNNPDSTIPSPYIKASKSDGSEDGTYEIKLTASDNAGNSSYGTVEFVWDTVDPGDIGIITAYNADGSELTTSNENSGPWVYTPTAQPYATWTATTGADFYTIIPNNDTTNPNSSSSPRYWDDPSLDWNDSATYSGSYIKSDNPIVSAPAPNNPGDNDGPVYLYVAAWDNAGNRSNRTSNQYVKFWIDTLSPVVENISVLPPSNSSLSIDYDYSDSSGYGRVYDQRTSDDPGFPGTQGSGIESYLWEQSSGSGTLSISNASTLTPTVSAASDGSEDGQYELKLTVTDKAGNAGTGYVSFIWDTTAPAQPNVTGINHTPSTSPIWAWNPAGGGNGHYRYKLERIQRDWESLGGGYSGSPTQVFDWVDSTATSYSASGLDDKYEYTLYVQESDEAGNWSASASQSIWIDTDYTSEPAITRDGNYLRNAGDRTVTWNWTTGLGNPANERYRYKLLASNSSEVISWTILSDNVSTLTINFATYSGGLSDDTYTLVVEEYNIDSSIWVGKEANSSVEIDATAPGIPVFNYNTGADTTGEAPSYKLTKNTTPYFRWQSGGEGNGNYRWSFDNSTWTNTSVYYYTASLSEGTYTFYVQERDDAGNWSASATYNLEIDTTAPTLSSILLKNKSTNAVDSTSYTVGTVIDIDVSGSGTNSTTYTSNDIQYMRFWNSGGSKFTYNYNSTQSGWNFSNGGGNADDGYKYVYCELIDYAGNVSVSRYDGITLDTVPPSVSSFNINNSTDTTTTTSSVTLNSSYSGANYMRISTDNGSHWSGWYTASTAKAWTLSTANGYSGYGAKKVTIQFSDYAGVYSRDSVTGQASHYTQVDDSIFYGSPIIGYANKGTYKTGTIYTYYQNFASDTGSANTYYIYYAYSPTGTKYYKGSTTSSSYYKNTYATGNLYYLFVRVYNPDIGYSNYSSYTPGFSSDITVIYDDDDTTDTSLASSIKSLLQSDLTSYSAISGTMPSWTVTLVPEDIISSTYTSEENIVYGDPIIVTPSSASVYGSAGKTRNIAAAGHGIVGMAFYGGLKLFETISTNYAPWGFTDQQPDEICFGNTYSYVADKYFMYTWRYGNSVWTSPLTSTSIPTSTSEDKVQIGYSDATLNERGLILTGNPTDGFIYGRSENYTDRYPVVRQGRFLYYGYDGLWTRAYTGKVYFVNLIARMDYGF